MKTLLRVDASIRHTGSYSRTLGDSFVRAWNARHPDGKVTVRDLSYDLLPHLSEGVANAFFAGDRDAAALILSNTVCDELKHAGELLITCPMYNFGIPSTLKAWLDQVVRVNETFTWSNEAGYTGLLKNKRAYIIMAMGDIRTNTTAAESLEAYITGMLAFIGITDVRVLLIDGTARRCFTDDWQAGFEAPVIKLLQ